MNMLYNPNIINSCIGALFCIFIITLFEVNISKNGEGFAKAQMNNRGASVWYANWREAFSWNKKVLPLFTGFLKLFCYSVICYGLILFTSDFFDIVPLANVFISVHIFVVISALLFDVFIKSINLRFLSKMNEKKRYIFCKGLAFGLISVYSILVFFVMPEIMYMI